MSKDFIHLAKILYFFHYSFLDDAFRKNLESALRFGNPLLVQVMDAQLYIVMSLE